MVALVALACGFRSAMYPWKSADTGDETTCDETTPENPERSLGALSFAKGVRLLSRVVLLRLFLKR
jgi:hypothetical protein